MVDILKAIDLYQQLNRRSTTKWNAFDAAVGGDRRLRGAHQFRGASRTGRDAHRLVQPGNMPRGNWKDAKDSVAFADMMLLLGHAGAKAYAPTNVMDALSSLVRSAITAPPGYTFVISDLSSVESRMVGWLSSSQEMLNIFSSGRDTYKVFATWYYGKQYEEITKKERNFCKPPVLGCAYMLSGGSYDKNGDPKGGLVAYAHDMGVSLSEQQAAQMVTLFRQQFREIVEMWTWLDQAARYVILSGHGATIEGYRVQLEMDREFLFIHLPSGRKLSYLKPEITLLPAPWDRSKKIENVTYMGYNQFTKNKWRRISTHPGKWVEQITQASSGDLFWHGLQLYDESSDDNTGVVLRVHDELVALVPEDRAEEELKRLEDCMAARPAWGDSNLYLGADGFISRRYRKD